MKVTYLVCQVAIYSKFARTRTFTPQVHRKKLLVARTFPPFPLTYFCEDILKIGSDVANKEILKANNRNTRKRCKICSKLTIKTPKQPQ